MRAAAGTAAAAARDGLSLRLRPELPSRAHGTGIKLEALGTKDSSHAAGLRPAMGAAGCRYGL